MSLIVQKFGGTSVADSGKILEAARKAVRAHRAGHRVIVVVSAMGKNTDRLIELAEQVCDHPPAREMDMLLATGEQVSVALMAMAVHTLGGRAISLTGAQIGIQTDSTHTRARIRCIDTHRLQAALDAGQIVIAAGFQGIDEDYNITTLGRGGSDTTAVALAAVLGADNCEIYTDVDGVYSTDPRILPEARKVSTISYDEMLELASLGAGVLHNRSVEFAKKFCIPLQVRSSFISEVPGTAVLARPESADSAVCGAALVKNEARVTVIGVPDEPGTSLMVFRELADRSVSVDMIVQNIGEDGRANISFTVIRDDLPATLQAAQAVVEKLGATDVGFDEGVAKVSVVGLGMAQQSGVAAKMFRALAEAGVNILMISTSEIKISVLVARLHALTALQAVHAAFELEKPPAQRLRLPRRVTVVPSPQTATTPVPAPEDRAVAAVSRLQGMEDLTVDAVELDETQARVTVEGIPDTPGLAAALFEGIGAAGIMVDMIVQDIGSGRQATLSFTVPRAELEKTVALAKQLAHQLNCGAVSSSPDVAKLSVFGIGLRSHTEVAIRMFQALGLAGINLQLIFTSEVRVSVLVGGVKGQKALEALQREFADAMD